MTNNFIFVVEKSRSEDLFLEIAKADWEMKFSITVSDDARSEVLNVSSTGQTGKSAESARTSFLCFFTLLIRVASRDSRDPEETI